MRVETLSLGVSVREREMASLCGATARCFEIPAMDGNSMHNRTSMGVGTGRLSVAGSGTSFFRRSPSSSKRPFPFTCLSISSDASKCSIIFPTISKLLNIFVFTYIFIFHNSDRYC